LLGDAPVPILPGVVEFGAPGALVPPRLNPPLPVPVVVLDPMPVPVVEAPPGADVMPAEPEFCVLIPGLVMMPGLAVPPAGAPTAAPPPAPRPAAAAIAVVPSSETATSAAT
jgi:hypothetical protein